MYASLRFKVTKLIYRLINQNELRRIKRRGSGIEGGSWGTHEHTEMLNFECRAALRTPRLSPRTSSPSVLEFNKSKQVGFLSEDAEKIARHETLMYHVLASFRKTRSFLGFSKLSALAGQCCDLNLPPTVRDWGPPAFSVLQGTKEHRSARQSLRKKIHITQGSIPAAGLQ